MSAAEYDSDNDAASSRALTMYDPCEPGLAISQEAGEWLRNAVFTLHHELIIWEAPCGFGKDTLVARTLVQLMLARPNSNPTACEALVIASTEAAAKHFFCKLMAQSIGCESVSGYLVLNESRNSQTIPAMASRVVVTTLAQIDMMNLPHENFSNLKYLVFADALALVNNWEGYGRHVVKKLGQIRLARLMLTLVDSSNKAIEAGRELYEMLTGVSPLDDVKVFKAKKSRHVHYFYSTYRDSAERAAKFNRILGGGPGEDGQVLILCDRDTRHVQELLGRAASTVYHHEAGAVSAYEAGMFSIAVSDFKNNEFRFQRSYNNTIVFYELPASLQEFRAQISKFGELNVHCLVPGHASKRPWAELKTFFPFKKIK